MKKTAQIVTIPLNKEGWNEGDLLKDDSGNFKLVNHSRETNVEDWQAQQLLVLSDDEIQEGDCIKDGNLITKADGIILSLIKNSNYQCKKIIASYPQIESTLLISKETVQVWIDSGTPGEGSIDIFLKENRRRDNNFLLGYVEMVNTDPQGNLLLEFEHECKHCGVMTTQPDKECYKAPSIPTDYEILKKSLKHSDNLYNADDKSKDYALSENQLWENSLRDYEAGYKQALKDLGYE